MSEEIKQVIVVRKDLKMRKGKIAAQSAHASMKVFFDNITVMDIDAGVENQYYCVIQNITEDMRDWMEGLFTKVVVSCNSEEELNELYREAEKRNLPCSYIVDSGLTEFHGVKTPTCIAIGPAKSEEINKITGNLKLL